MRSKKLSVGMTVVLALFVMATLMTSARAAAPKEKILHRFDSKVGTMPVAGLIFDAAGNLYGTTPNGGAGGVGTVFELTPRIGGGWTEKVLHSFSSDRAAFCPYARLAIDASGSLYGTTYGCGSGFGAVFELTPEAGGDWVYNVLHRFSGKDGQTPVAGLTLDASGNLYGTTQSGGDYDFGTVFELSPAAGGIWREKVLHSFNLNTSEGNTPYYGSLIFDAAGNLYGTTGYGGAYNLGTAFELSPVGDGSWTETVLHSFDNNGADGANPVAGLVFDASGNLYGTAGGGAYGFGAVYELTSTSAGTWTEMLLYSFDLNGTDAWAPTASLIFDAAGNLYSTTEAGGVYGVGTVFELTPNLGGNWTETVLHSFYNNGTDGYMPEFGGLIRDASGNLYGTTFEGGAYGYGTVFEIKP